MGERGRLRHQKKQGRKGERKGACMQCRVKLLGERGRLRHQVKQERMGERGCLKHQVKQGRIGERKWLGRYCRMKQRLQGERRGGESQ